MPRALLAALFIVITFYVLVALAAVGTQPWQEFEGQSEAGLAQILEKVTGTPIWATILAARRGDLDLLGHAGDPLRADPHPVRDGPRRHAAADVRPVSPRTQTPVQNTIIVAIVVAILAAIVPLDYLIDVVSIGTLTAFIVVSLGVIILRRREPDLPRGFKVPGYPVTPILSILACAYILASLHWYTWVIFAGWIAVFLVFYMLYGRRHSVLGQERGEEPVLDEPEVERP